VTVTPTLDLADLRRVTVAHDVMNLPQLSMSRLDGGLSLQYRGPTIVLEVIGMAGKSGDAASAGVLNLWHIAEAWPLRRRGGHVVPPFRGCGSRSMVGCRPKSTRIPTLLGDGSSRSPGT
jgi:hypothetical protein